MPDSLSPTISELERKSTADLLWEILKRIDEGAPMSDVRGMVHFVAFTMEAPGWTRDRPMNIDREAA